MAAQLSVAWATLARATRLSATKPGLEQQVFGRVAGNGQLGEHGQVGPGLFGLAEGAEHPLDVAAEVANHGASWQRAMRNHVIGTERRPVPATRQEFVAELAACADPAHAELGLARLVGTVPGRRGAPARRRPPWPGRS